MWVVPAQHDLVAGGELPVAEVQLGGGVEFAGGGEQCSGLPVEEAGLAAGAGEEQGVGAGPARVVPVGERDGVEVLGLVADDDSAVVSVGVEGGRDVPAAQLVERGTLPGVDLAPVHGQLDDTVAERVEGGAERATGGDFGELVVVADEDHLRAGVRRLRRRPRRGRGCRPSPLRRSRPGSWLSPRVARRGGERSSSMRSRHRPAAPVRPVRTERARRRPSRPLRRARGGCRVCGSCRCLLGRRSPRRVPLPR